MTSNPGQNLGPKVSALSALMIMSVGVLCGSCLKSGAIVSIPDSEMLFDKDTYQCLPYGWYAISYGHYDRLVQEEIECKAILENCKCD